MGREQRQAAYEAAYQSGELLALSNTFADLIVNPAANDTVCDFLRGKIRSIVRDRATAEALCPRDHYYGTKRPCIDSNYYETFNLPHVRLVDLCHDPLVSITERGHRHGIQVIRIRCHRVRHRLRCHDRRDCGRRYSRSRRGFTKEAWPADRSPILGLPPWVSPTCF